MSDRIRQAGEMGSRHGAAAVVVAHPANRRWLGQSDGDGEVVLLCSGAVRTVVPGVGETLDSALVGLGINQGALLGTDRVFGRELPGYPCLDLSGDLAAARRRKDPDEVEKVSVAARLASIGQESVRTAAAAGVTELELDGVARRAMSEEARRGVEAAIDLMAGERTALVDAPPGAGAIAAGDPVLFDLAPEYQGYWGDSCGCFAVGSPTAALRRRHGAVKAALEVGIRSARPGVEARALDAAVRAELERHGLSCPHHTGHGVGAEPQESPWLIPGDATPLEAGMTIAIEPGAYGDGIGVRLEHLIVIEADGARLLTTHSLNLIQGDTH